MFKFFVWEVACPIAKETIITFCIIFDKNSCLRNKTEILVRLSESIECVYVGKAEPSGGLGGFIPPPPDFPEKKN